MRTMSIAGRSASVVALGSTYFGGACAESDARKILDRYAELGGNLIDTARVYGDLERKIPGGSEEVIGRWLADRPDRDKFIISTKGGHPPVDHMEQPRLDRDSLTRDVMASREALGIHQIHVYWLHRDDPHRPVGDIMETLAGFRESGLIALAGASNWDPARIREANQYARAHSLPEFAGNQLQFSLAECAELPEPTCRAMTGEAYRMHRETGMMCFAFSSQAKGFFTILAEKGESALSEKARKRFLTPANREIFRRLSLLSRENAVSVPALALAYLTNQPFPVFPIVGASRPEQLDFLREAGEARLSPEEIRFLREMDV